ncbi:MAG TPA: hypothetical protein VME23_07765 [Terracidiphilus sp.]|nr:hypothetical protein [Terracidiphilus sp.]
MRRGRTSDSPRALLAIHKLIDPSEEYLGWQITALFAAQRALDDNRLEWNFANTGRDVPAAFLTGDDKCLAG